MKRKYKMLCVILMVLLLLLISTSCVKKSKYVHVSHEFSDSELVLNVGNTPYVNGDSVTLIGYRYSDYKTLSEDFSTNFTNLRIFNKTKYDSVLGQVIIHGYEIDIEDVHKFSNYKYFELKGKVIKQEEK